MSEQLTILTFTDKVLDGNNQLISSCNNLGLNLDVVQIDNWPHNAIKIKLLFDYLHNQLSNKLILYVDALDVMMFGSESEILSSYKKLGGDIVFSAEANYMFRQAREREYYWTRYPISHTIYDFLNSGSFIGKVGNLKIMLETMIEDYELNLDTLAVDPYIQSDQFLYHKYYVDNFHNTNSKLKVVLDHEQILFGCTGGRFCAHRFPDFSKRQALAFFSIERQILKFTKLNFLQVKSKDYRFENGRFFNYQTETTPSVIHIPGTWENFDRIINSYTNHQNLTKGNNLQVWASKIISSLSFVLSFLLQFLWSKRQSKIQP